MRGLLTPVRGHDALEFYGTYVNYRVSHRSWIGSGVVRNHPSHKMFKDRKI